jgi:hypothetical protein
MDTASGAPTPVDAAAVVGKKCLAVEVGSSEVESMQQLGKRFAALQADIEAERVARQAANEAERVARHNAQVQLAIETFKAKVVMCAAQVLEIAFGLRSFAPRGDADKVLRGIEAGHCIVVGAATHLNISAQACLEHFQTVIIDRNTYYWNNIAHPKPKSALRAEVVSCMKLCDTFPELAEVYAAQYAVIKSYDAINRLAAAMPSVAKRRPEGNRRGQQR